MIAWYWLIAAFLGGVLIGLFIEPEDVVTIVCFVPIVFYRMFFKLTLKPCSKEQFEAVRTTFRNGVKCWRIRNNLYLLFDPHATKIGNHLFFVRTKEE